MPSSWKASLSASAVIKVVNLALLLLAAQAAARLTWRLVPAPTVAGPAAAVTATGPVAGRPALAAVGHRIAGWHLFGQAGRPSRPAAHTPVNAPETHLNLTLRGVLAAHDPAHARAIVADASGHERSYRLGARLPGGAELAAIEADHIVLRRNGREETLHLPRGPGHDRRRPGRPYHRSVPAPSLSGAGQILKTYRAKLASNPQSFLDLVRPVPVVQNGMFQGFRLMPGRRLDLFRKLGLHPGDLVKEINGIQLDSPARGIQVLRDIRDSDEIYMRVERAGREVNLAYRIP